MSLIPTLTDTKPELEEPFRLLVENCQDILSIREADGRLRYTNPSFYRLLGYKQEAVVGSTCFDLIHPEDRATVLTALDEFKKTPGARESVRCRARHASGSWIPFEIVAYNMLDHPVIHGLVINGRDISGRERQEAGKDQLIADLKQTLAGFNALTGILNTCACCKKIQNENGSWQQIEAYIRDRAPVEFSHGMCPECVQLWFPDNSTTDRD